MAIQATLTKCDIANLKRSWGDKWRNYTSGKADIVIAANKLCAKMNGKGWIASVHENLGWHYCVLNGPLMVMETGHKYSCLLSSSANGFGAGEMFWNNDNHYGDPNQAVQEQMRIAQEFVNKCQKTIDATKTNISE